MKKYTFLYITSFTAAALSAVVIYASADILEVSVKILTRDPYRAARVPPYYAYFSLVASSIWLIAGTATLTTALIARKIYGCKITDSGVYRIILLGGIVGLIMALDDIWLFHDAVADKLKIPEILFHVFYATFLLGLIIYSRREFRHTPWLIFFSALACFGLSSGIDLAREFIGFATGVISDSEDVFKFCAVVLWGFYFLFICWTFFAERDSLYRTDST